MVKLIKVNDEMIQIGGSLVVLEAAEEASNDTRSHHGIRIRNKWICVAFAGFQLTVSLAALFQHVFSLAARPAPSGQSCILYCNFTATADERQPWIWTSTDLIIFDIGLFHHLWGIEQCIANYLDGGYMRFCWCLAHSGVLMYFIGLMTMNRKVGSVTNHFYLWPILCQTSIYGIGLLILSLSALPKLLPTLFDSSHGDYLGLWLPCFVYCFGTWINFLNVYILWHYYWYVEAEWKKTSPTSNDLHWRLRSTPRRQPSIIGIPRRPILPGSRRKNSNRFLAETALDQVEHYLGNSSLNSSPPLFPSFCSTQSSIQSVQLGEDVDEIEGGTQNPVS